MNTGQVISGAGHLGIIAVVLFGGWFTPPAPEVQVTPVSIVSAQEFAALQGGTHRPGPAPQIRPPQLPEIAPEPATRDAPLSTATDSPPIQSEPESAPSVPEPDAAPEVPVPTPPVSDVTDAPPVQPESAPQPSEDMTALVPAPAPEPESTPAPVVRPEAPPAPQQAPRIAPEPVERPDRDLPVDLESRPEVAPSDVPAAEPIEEQDAASPEETTTEIVTEADEPSTRAPATSVRPKTRPEQVAAAPPEPEQEASPTPSARPAVPARPEAAQPPAQQSSQDAIDKALAEALGGAEESGSPQADQAPAAASGPPLTAGEMDALRLAVGQCWNVDIGSPAFAVTVTVRFQLDRNGKVASDVSLVRAQGGDNSAQGTAFAAARRAVLRCGASGFTLPAEKYEQWRDIEMTFNPEKMRNL